MKMDSLIMKSSLALTKRVTRACHLTCLLILVKRPLWLDATNLDLLQNSTISDGGSISQWLDQSGNVMT